MKKIFFKLLIIISVFTILNSSFLINCYAQSGWFYQPLPVSAQVNDLKFFDANTGLVAMWSPNLIFRTTNGGYNWTTVYSTGRPAFELCLIDSMAVYVTSTTSSEYGMMLRSYNRGATWDSLPVANSWTANGISFVNRDTGWVGGTAGGAPYLWRTTNKGVNWVVQSGNTGFGRVFFLKNKVNGEYIGWAQNYEEVWKTTTSGVNWFRVMDVSANCSQLYFIDENTGFAATGDNMKKTTNGGLNWNAYYMPTGYNLFNRANNKFKLINKDTIYGVGGVRDFGLTLGGIIWVSTNGGVNWGFQQPDTSFHRGVFGGIDFANNDTGFCDFIRTNNGGGPIIFTEINTNITEMPGVFRLEQNYPNPFNSSTRIDFSVSVPSSVTIIVSDITGKDILRIFDNEHFNAGNYYAAIDISKMN
ncbi:MAG: hypothetical protein NTV87_11570, partial [Ignavibacteriae bacterium]|nr:hypothetical protein [Ignavibacteriota bacterium]